MELRLYLLEAVTAAGSVNSLHSTVAAVLVAVVLVAALAPALLHHVGPVGIPKRSSAVVFGLLLAAVAVVWTRLPGLLPSYLNQDEALFTAAAVRLLDAPLFWRSVDTGSSGPLNVFPLLIPALAGLTPDLASSRIVGLVMITASVCLFYAALRQVYPEKVARLASVPVAVTVALMQYGDFIHFTSEHGPILLLSIITFLFFRIAGSSGGQPAASRFEVFAVGFSAGLMPYMKMQGVPLAAVLCLLLLHLIWTRSRGNIRFCAGRMGWLAAGGLVPSIVAAAYLSIFSIWTLFWHSYIQTNLFTYAGLNAAGTTAKLRAVADMLLDTSDLRTLVGTVIAVSAFGFIGWLVQRRSAACDETSRRTSSRLPPVYSVVYLLAAIWTVVRPGNKFGHYLLFLIMPMGLMMAAFLDRLAAPDGTVARMPLRRALFVFAVLAVILWPAIDVAMRFRNGSRFIPNVASYLNNYRGPVAETILKVAPSGSSMAVWGFSLNLFAESGLVQANRYGCALWQIEENPLRDDFSSLNTWLI